MKWIILFGAIFGLCYGEAPVFGGYTPSGWKPDGASFKLPTEYGAPVQQPSASEIEITQENVQYAGMLGETTTVAALSNTYLPPGTTESEAATTTELPEEQPEEPDFISVQGLPKAQAAQYRVRADFRAPQQQFRQQQQQQFRQQSQQFRQQPQQFRQQPQQFRQQPQQFRQQPQQFRGNLKQAPQPQPQQAFNQRPNEFAEFIPQNQAAPANNQFNPNGRLRAPARQQQNFNFRSQQQFGRLELTPPATSYGVPDTQYGPPASTQDPIDITTTLRPTEETTDSDEEETEEKAPQEESTEENDESNEQGPVVAISNARSRGQYYILAPDNTLQKVVFMTSQTEEDKRNQGFSAQLKYSPVAPIRDPIYAYNEQGQLVRIYRKK